jgi:hypothetical protein
MDISSGIKRLGREADHLYLAGMVEIYLHSPIRLHAVVLN